jgi:hypothetical protein
MDLMIADVAALNDSTPGHGGCKHAQLFVHKKSKFTRVFELKSESFTSEAIEKFLQEEGAPNLIMSDCSKAQNNKNCNELFRLYCFKRQFSTPNM